MTVENARGSQVVLIRSGGVLGLSETFSVDNNTWIHDTGNPERRIEKPVDSSYFEEIVDRARQIRDEGIEHYVYPDYVTDRTTTTLTFQEDIGEETVVYELTVRSGDNVPNHVAELFNVIRKNTNST